jgi:chemotaxis protein methyltransferase CheR
VSEALTRATPLNRSEGLAIRAPERTLELIRDLVRAQTGMSYDESRLHFLKDRIASLALDRGFDSLLDYYYLLKYDAAADNEWLRVVDALAVQETYFWREADQIRAVADVILPSLAARGRRDVRIWSLPCATGEEPISLAIALTEAGWYERLPVQVRGSDASDAALRRARAGRYRERSFRQLPEAIRQRYFARTGAAEWTVAPELHRRVLSWTRVNAVRPEQWGEEADADVIFCRNLFIYFDSATVQRVVAAFAERMRSPGYLCIAAAESLLRLNTPFTLEDVGGAFVYVRA